MEEIISDTTSVSFEIKIDDNNIVFNTKIFQKSQIYRCVFIGNIKI